jgi:hypothetical protein
VPSAGADFQHSPERLVAGNQEVVALRSRAVLAGVNLLIRPVHPDAQHLDEHATPVWNVVDARLR